jgi:spermidine/putrescine transport system permease protein
MLIPLALLFVVSLTKRGEYGSLQWTHYTLENYRRCFDPLYLPVILRTLAYAGGATLLCLLVGYPFAYYLVFFAKGRKDVPLLMLMVPSWTSCLVGLYAWMILLGEEGLINHLLESLRIIQHPIQFLNTPFAVLLGLVYGYVPFMILPIYGALDKLPKSYIEASKDLGAGPLRTFVKVTFPLSLHGVLAGTILTFLWCLGDFLTPEFLGGARTYLVGNLIQNQFGMAGDWPFGASLSTVLMVSLGVAVYFYQKLGEPEESSVRAPV